jgi:hypothetical protein
MFATTLQQIPWFPVTFAVLDDHNRHRFHNPRGNYTPFIEKLHNLHNQQTPPVIELPTFTPDVPMSSSVDGGDVTSPPDQKMDDDSVEAPLVEEGEEEAGEASFIVEGEEEVEADSNESWGDRASRADRPELVVAAMPLEDLETLLPAEAYEPPAVHEAFMGALRAWMNRLFKWRQGFRERRSEWLDKALNGHVPWGVLWLKDIRGLAWEKRIRGELHALQTHF